MNEKEFEVFRQRRDTVLNALVQMNTLCENLNMKIQQEQLAKIEKQLRAHRFSVGVMGEFKRGKSTVINALLGEKVMPANIRPCSATLNRVTYGTEKGAEILFKDGSKKAVAFEELSEYVTKLSEYEDTCEDVEEAVVKYPCRLCEDGVDIIDTPGLNDDERMEKVSREVVPKLDVMVMTLVPDSPFSNSEASFVRDTLITSDISRMIFLVNKIDMVEEEAREELLDEIRKRIQEKTLDETEKLMGKDSEIYQNAEKVLHNISVYPLCASDALKGKLKNKPIFLEESGALKFEEALTKMLTGERAALELGRACSVLMSIAAQIHKEIESRHNAMNMTKQEFDKKQNALIAAIQETMAQQEAEKIQLEQKKQTLESKYIQDAQNYYSEIEVSLNELIYAVSQKWDAKKLAKKETQALAASNLQTQMIDHTNERLKAFTVRVLADMEKEIGKDAEKITAFTADTTKTMDTIVHASPADSKLMDGGDIIATAIDVVTDFAGIYGLGGVIAGARAAGVKGAVVGGGIGLVSTLAIAAACPVAGIPMLIISCAGGTLASKFATKSIFGKDIGEKARQELVESLKTSAAQTTAQLKEEKQLEKWLSEQVVTAYRNLQSAMSEECEKIITDAKVSLEQQKALALSKETEHAAMKEALQGQETLCRTIVQNISEITEWLKQQNA